jgi:hypothetical protein
VLDILGDSERFELLLALAELELLEVEEGAAVGFAFVEECWAKAGRARPSETTNARRTGRIMNSDGLG